MNRYKLKRNLLLGSLGMMFFPGVVLAEESSSSVTTTASITFTVMNDESEVYPYNPFGEGYLEFTNDPGGVQSLGSNDLKLMWISNFAFMPENMTYDYLNESHAVAKDVQAYVKKEPQDKATGEPITMRPLIQVWNSDKVSWDLKVKATDFVLADKDPKKTPGIPMKIYMNELVRNDNFVNDETLPEEANQDIYNFVQDNDSFVVPNQSHNLISYNNQMKLSGFSTFFFKEDQTDATKDPLALFVPKEQKIEANKKYHADITWTLATRLEP